VLGRIERNTNNIGNGQNVVLHILVQLASESNLYHPFIFYQKRKEKTKDSVNSSRITDVASSSLSFSFPLITDTF